MAEPVLVVVSYQADSESSRIYSSVLGAGARVVFLHQLAGTERRAALRRAVALIGIDLDSELPAGALHDAPELRFVQLVSAGADGAGLAGIPEDLVVASNPGGFAAATAEHVLAVTLALARRLPAQHAALARGDFGHPELHTLDGAVCGILGFGGIGKAAARLMQAFGGRIHAVNSTGLTAEPVDFAGTLADLHRVLAAADVLLISLPLTKATRGLIGKPELSRMKPAAIFVNVARAAIVDERALYEHLRDHPHFTAGLDVWWHEPRAGQQFRAGYPFLDLPNVIGTPHSARDVAGALPAAARMAAASVARYLRGEPVAGLVSRDDYR